jgi:hypothetical protein
MMRTDRRAKVTLTCSIFEQYEQDLSSTSGQAELVLALFFKKSRSVLANELFDVYPFGNFH